MMIARLQLIQTVRRQFEKQTPENEYLVTKSGRIGLKQLVFGNHDGTIISRV